MEMTPGEIAYNAYCQKVDWKSVRGDSLPKYADQTDKLRSAWEQAAAAVIAAIVRKDISLI